MAYTDQRMSSNRITALIIVALIHIFLGYALVTGLAYSAAQQIIKKVTTVDIKKDEPKKPPPPPPPPKNLPPPPVAPPVKINVAVAPPQIQTVTVAPPPAPPVLIAPSAPPAPPAPPPPRFTPTGAQPRGNPGDWVTTEDYPARALREERAGSTGIRLSVGADGRASGCEVTSSSGSPDLDEAACTYAQRRARFTPAKDGDGRPTTGSFTTHIKWVIPKE